MAHPTAAEKAAIAERRSRVLQLRSQGLSLQQICDAERRRAEAAGEPAPYPNARRVGGDLSRAQAEIKKLLAFESANREILDLERLDSMVRAVNVVMQNAQAGGQPELVLAAADRLMRLQKQRAIVAEGAMPAATQDRVETLAGRAYAKKHMRVLPGGKAVG
jgi:DNA-binding CsgD family transcriptional regulator